MKVEGRYHFPAPPERVWTRLQDPQALAAAIPGCRTLEPLPDNQFAAVLSIGVAAFKGTYSGKVALRNQQPPHSYDLHVEGSARPGFVNGVGHIALEAEEHDGAAGTLVRVDGDAQVGGPVLSVGSRLVAPTAKLLMNQFFTAMRRRRPKVGIVLGEPSVLINTGVAFCGTLQHRVMDSGRFVPPPPK